MQQNMQLEMQRDDSKVIFTIFIFPLAFVFTIELRAKQMKKRSAEISADAIKCKKICSAEWNGLWNRVAIRRAAFCEKENC